jgi:predicted transcriptional regulator
MPAEVAQPRDRVKERRRAVALARHYRDQEGLPIAEVARRLGRAEATIKAYLYDPDRREGAGGQGPLPGCVPRLRRVHVVPAGGRLIRRRQGVQRS